MRFMEHIINSFKPKEHARNERRYLQWRGMPWGNMHFVPLAWGKEDQILGYERHLINALQAPIQDRAKFTTFHVSKFRPWKRFRVKPTIENWT